MDPVLIVSSLGTIVAAIVGLIVTCHVERRMLNSRRQDKNDTAAG